MTYYKNWHVVGDGRFYERIDELGRRIRTGEKGRKPRPFGNVIELDFLKDDWSPDDRGGSGRRDDD